jgi:UDP-N-acetylmuramyl pentapeptide phosphotransferase/UDP-N-acetylglucosamine-1-phosphate transferase
VISTIGIFIGASFLTWALGFPVRKLLERYNYWDHPNHRSSHTTSVLRGGGVAIVITQLIAICFLVCPDHPSFGWVWIAGILALTTIGLLDDKRDAPISLRLGIQVISSLSILLVLKGGDWTVVEITLGLALMVSFVNFVNFMDGINGLVVMQMLLIPMGLVVLVGSGSVLSEPKLLIIMVALVSAGAAVGFLPHNFPSPKMFLGDAGSVTIGFSCAVLVLWAFSTASSVVLETTLLVLPCYFYFDGGATLLRRLFSGEKWWLPHREHYYQKLVRSGMSHGRTTMIIGGLQLTVTFFAWGILRYQAAWWIALVGVLVIWGLGAVCAELLFRRSLNVR